MGFLWILNVINLTYSRYQKIKLPLLDRGQKDFRTQYQLCEEIQRGGFGIVYKAYRVSDGLSVAVKYVEHKHVREWTMVCFLSF